MDKFKMHLGTSTEDFDMRRELSFEGGIMQGFELLNNLNSDWYRLDCPAQAKHELFFMDKHKEIKVTKAIYKKKGGLEKLELKFSARFHALREYSCVYLRKSASDETNRLILMKNNEHLKIIKCNDDGMLKGVESLLDIAKMNKNVDILRKEHGVDL